MGSVTRSRGDATNPSTVGGANEYAGFVAPARPDQSTIAQSGGYYGDKVQTQANPLGRSGSTGY
jgi:hypothetical protein